MYEIVKKIIIRISLLTIWLVNVSNLLAQTDGLSSTYSGRAEICCYVGAEILKCKLIIDEDNRKYKYRLFHHDLCNDLGKSRHVFSGDYKVNSDTLILYNKNNCSVNLLIKNDSLILEQNDVDLISIGEFDINTLCYYYKKYSDFLKLTAKNIE